MNKSSTYTYEPEGHGITEFHDWLMNKPELGSYSDDVWNILHHGLRLAETIHKDDIRVNDKTPYSTHFIEMIIEFIERESAKEDGKPIESDHLLVLALHDTMEEHPEFWHDILRLFGLSVFRDVLVLSTGGIPWGYRGEMLSYFSEYYPEWQDIKGQPSTQEEKILLDIIHVISPLDPFLKLRNKSRYSSHPHSPEFQQIENAMQLYVAKIILGKNKVKKEYLSVDDGYLGLGNYCYFDENDTRRKLQDMLHNMRDMVTMEKIKPGYIRTRRIKAYILGVKLKVFGMNSEFAELETAFQNTGHTMLTHQDVLQNLNIIDRFQHLKNLLEKTLGHESISSTEIEGLRRKIHDLGSDVGLFDMSEEFHEEYEELKNIFNKLSGLSIKNLGNQNGKRNSESH